MNLLRVWGLLITIGLVLSVSLIFIYRNLIHRETQFANTLITYLNTHNASLRFSYRQVSINPIELFLGNDTLYHINILFLKNNQSITIHSFRLIQFHTKNFHISDLAFTLKGIKTHFYLTKHPVLNDVLHRTDTTLFIHLHRRSLQIKSVFKQKGKTVGNIMSTYDNAPHLNRTDPSIFIESLGQLQVHSVNIHLNLPLKLKISALPLPAFMLGALKAMHDKQLPLLIAGYSIYNGYTRTREINLQIQVKSAGDLLFHTKILSAHPLYLGNQLKWLSNMILKSSNASEHNTYLKSATLTLINKGFIHHLLATIASNQNTSLSELKTRIQGSIHSLARSSHIPQIKKTLMTFSQFLRNPNDVIVSINPKIPIPISFPRQYLSTRHLNQEAFENQFHRLKNVTARQILFESFEKNRSENTQRIMDLLRYTIKTSGF